MACAWDFTITRSSSPGWPTAAFPGNSYSTTPARTSSSIKLAESVGGLEWYIVEQESYPYPPLESVRRSFANLKKILGRKG